MRTAMRAMVGMSLVSGLLVASNPASAGTLKNLVNEYLANGAPGGATGWCMGVTAGNPASGTPLITWACNGDADQNWTPATFWSSFVQLKNGINPILCAGLANGSTNEGTQLQNITCHTTPNASDDQGWLPVFSQYDPTGHVCNTYWNEKYYSQSRGVGAQRVFGVSGGAGHVTNGTNIILWHANGSSDQTWCSY